ncbi:hypothetical protein BT528P2_00020 [Bacteroides phage BT528P2]|nr:hypothetical protein BT498P1_00033 [Bacteroides phage BT498P1]WAX09311.1 hypothetical protein BT528P1_00020 [Bacteroides phage BT528P1]WAX09357.1 hypothetical protein BT528P2_00020 [Bacteroides phage BT528P2]
MGNERYNNLGNNGGARGMCSRNDNDTGLRMADRYVDARVIAKIFNVRTFVFLNFMRERGYVPKLDTRKRGTPRYLCPAHVIEDNRIEFQTYCKNLFDRRSPMSVSEERKKMVNACLSTDRYEAAQFEEKLAAKESRTKRVLRVSREKTEGSEMPRIYELRHYTDGSISLFEWDGDAWVFLDGERNSLLKDQFLNKVAKECAIML